jgi:hypothetical protein
LTLLHAMRRDYVRWVPRTWYVSDVVTVTHDDGYLLRTPLLLHAELGAFPDVAAIESSLVIVPQHEARKLREDCVALRATCAQLQTELQQLRSRNADDLRACAALPNAFVKDLEARHRKLIGDMRAEVDACKQVITLLTNQLVKAKDVKAERPSATDRKLKERDAHWKQRLDDVQKDMREDSRKKTTLMAQQALALCAFEKYYSHMKDAFDVNFEVLLSEQRGAFGTWLSGPCLVMLHEPCALWQSA